jgi:RimJ/RimL family protein N-acetyltransferase
MSEFDFTSFPVLETERLALRRITLDDMEAWQDVWSHPDVLRYLTDFETTPSKEEVIEVIDWADNIFKEKSGMRWAITLKPKSKLIGSCGFHLYEKENRCAEIGYELHHEFWRKGIMSEALREILRFGFEDMNLHRIQADVTVGNEASAGILRQFGFTLEGTWRERTYFKGQFHDLWQFGLLEDEYRTTLI